jgi:hypothetical protein
MCRGEETQIRGRQEDMVLREFQGPLADPLQALDVDQRGFGADAHHLLIRTSVAKRYLMLDVKSGVSHQNTSISVI